MFYIAMSIALLIALGVGLYTTLRVDKMIDKEEEPHIPHSHQQQ